MKKLFNEFTIQDWSIAPTQKNQKQQWVSKMDTYKILNTE